MENSDNGAHSRNNDMKANDSFSNPNYISKTKPSTYAYKPEKKLPPRADAQPVTPESSLGHRPSRRGSDYHRSSKQYTSAVK